MSGPDETRLERDLRAALQRLDPGPAPAALRERLAAVPDMAAGRPSVRERISRVAVPVLGAAAVVLLLVLAAPLVIAPGTGPGTGGSQAPVTTFDPSLVGPGLVSAPVLEAEALVVAILLVGGGLVVALSPSGPRRAGAALVLVAAMVLGGTQVLGTHAATGPVASSGGIGMLNVEPSEPSARWPAYVSAAPGEPFSFAFSVQNDGPLPIRLEGVIDDPAAVGYTMPRAVWRDEEPDGGIGGPAAPFAPMDLAPGQHVLLWLVATAPACAAGPSYDPAADQLDLVGMPPVRVRYTVLGFPRTATIDLPFDVLQPYRAGCQAQP